MADQFTSTNWSIVRAAAGDGSAARAALENLCAGVWRPLYAFARRWGCDHHDAEDAVQGFIASLLQGESFRHVGPQHGRFRTFLMAGLRNHLCDRADRATTQKRGGHVEHVTLVTGEEAYLAEAARMETPERAFERIWALELFEKAKARLAEECAASDKGPVFAALFLEGQSSESEDYAMLSRRLGLSEGSLRTAAMRLRRRLRDLIRAQLADTVHKRSDLDEEMACVQAALLG